MVPIRVRIFTDAGPVAYPVSGTLTCWARVGFRVTPVMQLLLSGCYEGGATVYLDAKIELGTLIIAVLQADPENSRPEVDAEGLRHVRRGLVVVVPDL